MQIIERSDNGNERRTHIKYVHGTAKLSTIYYLEKCASPRTSEDCAFGRIASKVTASDGLERVRARAIFATKQKVSTKNNKFRAGVRIIERSDKAFRRSDIGKNEQ